MGVRVSYIFHAKVKTNVIVTQRAGHAFDVMASTANDELNSYDGFICEGGDGFFNELLNGFLLSRHKASYPPCPSDLDHYDESDGSAPDSERSNAEISGQNEEQFHLFTYSTQNRYKATNHSIEDGSHKFRYGFYGDVITESEKYRWMGPKRYNYAGTKVFMRHRSYEAEIAYVESESEKSNYKLEKGSLLSRVKDICIPDKSERTICRANCGVCNMKPLNVPKRSRGKPYSRP